MIIYISIILLNFIFGTDYLEKTNSLYQTPKNNFVANQKSSIILSESLNSEIYRVGPGDKFFLSVLSNNIAINEYLVVSPLGDIILPNLSLININRLTLKEVFSLIEYKYNEKFENTQFNMTITDIRQFKVEIMGLQDSPIYITVNPTQKVSDIYNILLTKNISNFNNSYLSRRNIVLDRNEKESNIDMLKVNRYINSYNPYLLEGDIISFLKKKTEVHINGGVYNVGVYEYKSDEKLFDFINMIGGFTYDADTVNIQIYRTDNIKDENIFIDKETIDKNIILQPYDFINVQQLKKYNNRNTVKIIGEVNTPGTYTLENSMTIEDLLMKSGGFTQYADTTKILISNDNLKEIRDPEYERIELIPPQNRTISEISYLKSKKIVKSGVIISGNNKITKKIFKQTLNSDDIIEIPKLLKYIEIIGGINNPGLYPYDDNLTVNDYIELAGGRSQISTKKIYIINSLNEKNRVRNSSIKLNNGDILFIETKQDMNLWNKLKESMGVMGQIATLIAVIQSAQSN